MLEPPLAVGVAHHVIVVVTISGAGPVGEVQQEEIGRSLGAVSFYLFHPQVGVVMARAAFTGTGDHGQLLVSLELALANLEDPAGGETRQQQLGVVSIERKAVFRIE